MFSVLEKMYKSKDYISLYTNCEDNSKFCYGKIIDFDNKNFLFLMISPDGKYDGLLVKPIADIIRINKNDLYSERMKKLLDLSIIDDYLLNHKKSNDVLSFVLLMSKTNNKIVSIELNNSGTDDVVGIVNMVSDTICEIQQIDFYGHTDGIAYLKLDDISQASFDSATEQTLLKLRESNQGTD